MKVLEERPCEDLSATDPLLRRVVLALGATEEENALAALALLDPASAVEWILEPRIEQDDARMGRLLRILLPLLAQRGDPSLLQRVWPLARTGDMASAAATATAEALYATQSLPSVEEAAALLDAAPASAATLRVAALGAEAAGDHQRAHDLLTRLVFADPSAANIRNVQRWRGRLAAAEGREVRVALLGSYTLDLLAGYLDAECRVLGLSPAVYSAPFNSWEREALDPAAGFRVFDADIAILAVALDDLVPDLAGPLDVQSLDAAGVEAVERLASAAERISDWFGGVLMVHGFHSAYGDPLGNASSASRSEWVNELNRRVAERIRRMPRAHYVDMADLLLRRTSGPLDDAKMRHFAKLRLSADATAQLARVHAGHIAAVKGLTRKCVVVDLDNTLWGGVVGEDGIDGIRLGTTAPGVEYRDFQQFLQSLSSRGILLAIASKNNEADALHVLREHPSMVLREDAFAAMQINWRPKPESLRQIALDLNIGVDSLVFLDDNPNERALMRQALPEVLTPELPHDPALYRQALERLPQLQALVVTEEDRARTGLYRAQRQRDQVRVQSTSLEAYLGSLDIHVSVARDDSRSIERVHQLLQRTNQFNLTTRRHAAADIASWMADPAWHVYGLKARDRYGDHGLSAVAIVESADAAWRIDSLLMSCRVISYGIETALLAAIVEDAAAAGAARVIGEFIPTAKNAPAADFYARSGFTAAATHDAVHLYELDLTRPVPACPAWIGLERQ